MVTGNYGSYSARTVEVINYWRVVVDDEEMEDETMVICTREGRGGGEMIESRDQSRQSSQSLHGRLNGEIDRAVVDVMRDN